MKKDILKSVMKLAWQFVKRNGFSMSAALKAAWANAKLKAQMKKGIVRFYFRKVNGSIREAWGTLNENIMPEIQGNGRAKNDTIQVYYDTEVESYRSFKKANLIGMAL